MNPEPETPTPPEPPAPAPAPAEETPEPIAPGWYDLLREVLRVPADASPETVIDTLKEQMARADEAEGCRRQLAELAADHERRACADLIARGRAEGKIAENDMEYVRSLDAAALKAHLAHTAAKIPLGRAGRGAAHGHLTTEDRAAIRRLRLDPEKDLATKQERMN